MAHNDALSIVQKYFPEVESVVDGKKDMIIEVTEADDRLGTKKNHKTCALAVACKRALHLDGVIMSIKTAYLIKDNKATRMAIRESATREIVSFDRDAGFTPGTYALVPISPANRLGAHTGGENKKRPRTSKRVRVAIHQTRRIRARLGGKDE